MKALILKGKHKGKIVEVSQWCNDWFTLSPTVYDGCTVQEANDICRKPMSPSSIALTFKGIAEVIEHDNNGFLFKLFKPSLLNGEWVRQGEDFYKWTFKKIKR